MGGVRFLRRWQQWNEFRQQLFAHYNLDEAKAQELQELELTTEVDSLGLVEIIMAVEEAFDIRFVEAKRERKS